MTTGRNTGPWSYLLSNISFTGSDLGSWACKIMAVYLEMVVLSGWILAFLPSVVNWDVEIQISNAGNLEESGETREIRTILITAQFTGDFKYTWGADQKHQVLICNFRFLAQSNCHIRVLGSCSPLPPCQHRYLLAVTSASV